jgi:hypothetical protein
MAAASLSEPQVLAHTKRHLFVDDTDQGYSVCDTQFAQSEWLSGRKLSSQIRADLAPFNHVEIGGGYPDLVGVHPLKDAYLAGGERPTEPPLVAIEAKGHTESGNVDIEKGLQQAYTYLPEANAVYLTAPADAITQGIQSAARELNVGLLSVDAEGTLSLTEPPRVVGNRSSDDASAIRFQATAQGVADKSFSLNHPKNYLGYPLALYHPDPTEEVLSEYVVSDLAGAHNGAVFLDLIEETPTGEQLTPLGREVIRFAVNRYPSIDAALDRFQDWQRSQKRFCELAPEWGLLTRRVLWAYPATQILVEELQTLHEEGTEEPSLVQLIERLHTTKPTFTIELFIRGTDNARSRVLTDDGNLRRNPLTDGEVYHSPTVFQLKAMLYHAGILTDRGSEPHRLMPESDIWALREPLY